MRQNNAHEAHPQAHVLNQWQLSANNVGHRPNSLGTYVRGGRRTDKNLDQVWKEKRTPDTKDPWTNHVVQE
jgi:hypothetical protein